uniref:hypothetical protein n=1 Tax=Bordetella sputigena TaxID=1416810 RepID=UPI0039EF086E
MLDRLGGFAAAGCASARNRLRILHGLDRLYERRFRADYDEDYAELIDGPGKRALEAICAMIDDEAIPRHVRHAVVGNLSEGLGACEGGTLSNLLAAQRALIMSSGGVRARFWKMKEDSIRALLHEAVHQKFSGRASYVGREVHYVNAVWNHLADEFGLEAVPDPRATQIRPFDPRFLDECRRKARAAITPDKLAMRLAEQCLAAFRAGAPDGALEVPYGVGIPPWFDSALDGILLELGLGVDRLTLHAFVQLDEAGQRYRIRTDPTPVAVALLETMHAEGLIEGSPVHRGEWQDHEGAATVAWTYGSLAWRSPLVDGALAGTGWDARYASPEVLGMEDLRRWRATLGPRAADRGPIELRAVIQSHDAKALIDMPPEWLADAETALLLMARLGDSEADRYLDMHAAYFRDRFPHDERPAFIDGAMGLGRAAAALACGWYPDLYALLNERPKAGGMTRLQRWVDQRNASAIDIARDLADNGWGGAQRPSRQGLAFFRLLRGNPDRPILYEAMAKDNHLGIAAWRRLLASDQVLPHISGQMTELMLAPRKDGVGALSAAMNGRCARAVLEFHHALTDPAILPLVRKCLMVLLSSTGARFPSALKGVTALMYGMDGGCSSTLAAYGNIVADPLILKEIYRDLPELFGIRGGKGGMGGRARQRSPLWYAMAKGHLGAIEAYGRILTEPLVRERLRAHMPDLIAGRGPRGETALHTALAKGLSDAIDAYRVLINHAYIAPLIRDRLPELLINRRTSGIKGVVAARDAAHHGALAAYRGILVHPAVGPHIADAIRQRMLTSMRSAAGRPLASGPDSDWSRLDPAAWEARVDQWLAFYIESRLSPAGLIERIGLRLRFWITHHRFAR